jgi:hypothetical protein
VLLGSEAGCLNSFAADLPDDVLLDDLRAGVKAEKIVVYLEWLAPADFPIKADLKEGRWWMAPKGWFEQTVMRRQARLDEAARLVDKSFDEWFPVDKYDKAEAGPRLAGLRRYSWATTSASAGRSFDFTAMTVAELVDWARVAVKTGEIAVYEELAKFSLRPAAADKPLTAAEYEAAAKEYAKKYDINLGTAKSEDSLEKIPKANPADPQFYKTPTTDNPSALPNEVDDTCPSDNCRSESLDTADDDVKKWFGDEAAQNMWGDQKLGKKGGGGFLASTTRVVEIPEPKKLWRYCGGDSEPTGGWWSLTPLEGDPRVENALFPVDASQGMPKGGTGEKLVECTVDKPMKVLMGVGAPRCSNKPGGPIQVCMPYNSVGAKPGKSATLV